MKNVLDKKYLILLLTVGTLIFIISLFTTNFSKKTESLVLPDSATLSDNVEILPDNFGNFLILSANENASHIAYFDGRNKVIG